MSERLMSERLTIEFPNDDLRDEFMSWLSCSGEQHFMNFIDDDSISMNIRFDYKHAFPAWGYDKEKDGDPVIECEL